MYIMPPFDVSFVITTTILCALGVVTRGRKRWVERVLKTGLALVSVWGVLILYSQGVIY